MRAGMIGERSVAAGHDVLWWTSRFDYATMEQRPGSMYHDTAAGRVLLLDGVSYSRNVSVARLRNHRQMARQFKRLAEHHQPPNVIVASYPTIELAEAAVTYGKAHGVPVIVDVRDLWPDLFLDVIPRWARGVGRIALTPLYRSRRAVMQGADAVFAINSDFLMWANAAGGRVQSTLDDVFPLAYERTHYPADVLADAESRWSDLGLESRHRIACFFGNLSARVLDLDTVIEAARQIESVDPDARIVLCGDNGQLPQLQELADGLPVLLPGWVDGPQIQTLMARSRVGILPYRSRWDFVGSIPNKPIEYLSGDLPVISGLEGELERLLTSERCGLHIAEGDPGALVVALQTIFHDDALAAELSANARRVFEERFSAESVYGRYLDKVVKLATL